MANKLESRPTHLSQSKPPATPLESKQTSSSFVQIFGLLALGAFLVTLGPQNALSIGAVGSLSRLIGFVMSGFVLAIVLFKGRLPRFSAFHIFFLLFAASLLISSLLSSDITACVSRVVTYFQLFFMVIAIQELITNKTRLRYILFAFVIGGLVASAGTIINAVQFNTDSIYTPRFVFSGTNENDTALLLVLVIPMAWYVSLQFKSILLILANWVSILLAIISVLLTGSRTAFIVLPIALLFIPLTFFRRLRFTSIVVIVIIGAIGFVIATNVIPERTLQRFSTIQSQIDDFSIGNRSYLWQLSIDAWVERPIVGYGPGTDKSVVDVNVSHNIFLSVLLEQGLLGLVFYCGMIAAAVSSLFRLPPLQRTFMLITFMIWIIGTQTLSWQYEKTTWFLFALAITMKSIFLPTQNLNEVTSRIR